MNTNRPIPYLVTDLPIPYRVRVATPSRELRDFVVPRLGIQGSAPPDRASGLRLKGARAA